MAAIKPGKKAKLSRQYRQESFLCRIVIHILAIFFDFGHPFKYNSHRENELKKLGLMGAGRLSGFAVLALLVPKLSE